VCGSAEGGPDSSSTRGGGFIVADMLQHRRGFGQAQLAVAVCVELAEDALQLLLLAR
jgi:hypothetical protein